MTKTKKVITRFFTIADYDEETAFLHEQHLQGWKFKKVILPCFFIFEKSEKEDYIYQLEYVNKKQGEDYFTLYQDYGWEYCGSCVGWNYFRKPADQVHSAIDKEIFSDDSSKLKMISNISRTRLIPLVIILCSLFINIFIQQNRQSMVDHILFIILLLLILIYLVLIPSIWIKLRKKKKELGYK
ncbi:hypothetical protein HMPREF9318_01770 [Streptococcus urinalis FB127-CNA-2]|uniref:PF11193 family protein n=1 Tax=Streptococcus urinalis 2285-97 TaxID=764291 RepID=G5KE78_9STRE|nr:DUF2812 domain-containing protein [Streptococcus urinalis]EHJ57676.1 hypothetical protein STRUR_2016 [Streptococcus urinalis 2285-97]EKS18271.1 hypothetical protein HMPREF9318_01770 [Streptococcus urinalis FB127-CNA-2]VEF32855.1 Protein of uncharacterised function (DUF2812) [Streptococcus urinalis]